MQANIHSLHIPLTLILDLKVKTFFLKVVMVPIMKLTGTEHRTPCKYIFYTTRSASGVESKGQTFFSENGNVAYHIRREWGIEHHEHT